MKAALRAIGLASITVLAWLSCAGVATAHRPPPSPPEDTLTLQELMDARIDPAADALWDAVAYVSTLQGTEDRRPRSVREWNGVRGHALALIDATALLERRGRRITRTAGQPGPGELGASEIRDRIAATPDSFARLAGALRAAAAKALDAVDARDAQRLLDAGGDIDEACEACHVAYWYPDQRRASR